MDDGSVFLAASLILLTNVAGSAPGIYHGTLDFDPDSDDHIDSTQLLPYPALPSSDSSASQTHPDVPTSILVTEFHFILLYRDRIIGICALNGKQTYEDVIPLVSRTVRMSRNVSQTATETK